MPEARPSNAPSQMRGPVLSKLCLERLPHKPSMMGEDAYNQVKEMFATFRSDILSDYKESLRSNLETIRQEVRSR